MAIWFGKWVISLIADEAVIISLLNIFRLEAWLTRLDLGEFYFFILPDLFGIGYKAIG